MSSHFYLRITFPNPHILLKAKALCLCFSFKICHIMLFSASGSTDDNISLLSITTKCAIIDFLKFLVCLTFFAVSMNMGNRRVLLMYDNIIDN